MLEENYPIYICLLGYTIKMFTDDDTIAAISTPVGEGGIGIVRLSGKKAFEIADKIFYSPKGKKLSDAPSHTIHHGHIKDFPKNEIVDEVLVSVMRAPNTYTAEDIVEINCHGGMVVLRKTLELIIKNNARLAEPGEFTKRAFLNGRIDLSKAEAVLDLIKAKTDESSKLALQQLHGKLSEKISDLMNKLTDLCAVVEAYIDFPEEDIELSNKNEMIKTTRDLISELEFLLKTYDEARFFRDGLAVAIVGRPNVGKSSLLNALLQRDRAIVTDIPGTTRDVIEEYLNIDGLPLRIIDTAGIRASHDMAEIEGVKRSMGAIEDADVVIAVIDGTKTLRDEDLKVLEKIKDKNSIIAVNKTDMPMAENNLVSSLGNYSKNILKISATKGNGLDELKKAIFGLSIKNWQEQREGIVITNLRHKTVIDGARESLKDSLKTLESGEPFEITAVGLRDALDKLGEIIGVVTTEDILNKIFSKFCIGK